MPDKNLIYRKLDEMIKQLRYLRKLEALEEKKFVLEETNLFLAERVMERLIGAALDINMHLVADLSGEVPDDYFSSFIELAKCGVLPLSFAKKLAPSTSLRNILVHEYQELNLKKFREAMGMALHEFPRYVKYVQQCVDGKRPLRRKRHSHKRASGAAE